MASLVIRLFVAEVATKALLSTQPQLTFDDGVHTAFFTAAALATAIRMASVPRQPNQLT